MSDRFGFPLVCPRCRGPVACVTSTGAGASPEPEAFVCAPCGASYPIVLGIPDFRVAPDPWIGIEADREKGLALDRDTQGMDLDGMVRHYWTMTPDTPQELAERYVAHVMSAERRSRAWLASVMGARREEDRDDDRGGARASGRARWLDIGCGTADLAAVATRDVAMEGVDVVGIDVAFRWLVVARRRLMRRGLPVRLVCCNAEALPFPDQSFDRAFAAGTIEHVHGKRDMLRESRRVLATGGTLHARTVNRFSLLPEPHVGLFGVGWLSPRLADAYVHLRTGRHYLHHRLVSARELQVLLHEAGFRSVQVGAAATLDTDRERVAASRLRFLLPAYEFARRAPLVSWLLRRVAPLLDASARKV